MEEYRLRLFNNENDDVNKCEMGRACNMNGEESNVCRILVGKPEGKRPLGCLRHRWVDNSKMYGIGACWGDMDWIN
jgi:hypothetical protein